MPEWFERELVCPRDQLPVKKADSSLVCTDGHSYPIVQGTPVMLIDEPEQTLWVAEASFAAARDNRAADADERYIETLGLHEPDRKDLANETAIGGSIDSVVQYMIAATCGILYRPLLRSLRKYPIPDIRLPEGRNKRLLDIGCNWGRWSIAAAAKGYDVIGLDPSLGAVLAAARVTDQLGLKARYVVGDGRYLPFPNDSADVSFSYSVLQHLSRTDVGLVLDQISRVLKPGGESLIQMANKYGLRTSYNLARRGFSEGEGFEVRFWSPNELKRVFEERIGPSSLSVDGYFGLGIQKSDIGFMPAKYRLIIRCSEILRAMSRTIPWITCVADSLYVHSDAPSVQ